jgi:hypothetical protein
MACQPNGTYWSVLRQCAGVTGVNSPSKAGMRLVPNLDSLDSSSFFTTAVLCTHGTTIAFA